MGVDWVVVPGKNGSFGLAVVDPLGIFGLAVVDPLGIFGLANPVGNDPFAISTFCWSVGSVSLMLLSNEMPNAVKRLWLRLSLIMPTMLCPPIVSQFVMFSNVWAYICGSVFLPYCGTESTNV